MIWFILSIFSSALIALIFKAFTFHRVNTFHAIVVNYSVCTLLGSLFSPTSPFTLPFWNMPWFPAALIMGVLFITTFNLMGYTTQKLGVTVAAVATKLSMVVPVAAAVFLYQDSLSLLKITGIILAIMAVWLTARQPKSVSGKLPLKILLLPLSLFCITGFMDTYLKYIEINYLPGTDFNTFLIFLFGTAAFLGWVMLIGRKILWKDPVHARSLIAGILLGIPNYGSIYFLIKTLNLEGWESSVIFPINNIGIVGLSAFGAWLIFREQLSRANLAGLGLAVLSILLIAYQS